MVKAHTANDFGKVAVLMGGWSAEREISLRSGAAVLAALQRCGIDAHGIDADHDVLQRLIGQDFSRVFIVWHGRGGESGELQGALDLLQLPYTGSGVLASALGMDKWRSKLVWQAAGLPTPEFSLLDGQSDFAAVEQRLGLPLFVKPANEGSSIGISKVTVAGDTSNAYAKAAKYDSLVLAEQFIGGGDYTVAILGTRALPVVRIVPATDFYDYEAKYSRADTRYLCPCGLSVEQEESMQKVALQAFALLGCDGWGRVDFLLDEHGRPFVLEVNTVPGMTDHSLVPMAARAAGIGFDELVWQILAGSL
ncbi:MAG: D-alanine--D-alanine ligase [Thiohalomonadaceae bacterium]